MAQSTLAFALAFLVVWSGAYVWRSSSLRRLVNTPTKPSNETIESVPCASFPAMLGQVGILRDGLKDESSSSCRGSVSSGYREGMSDVNWTISFVATKRFIVESFSASPRTRQRMLLDWPLKDAAQAATQLGGILCMPRLSVLWQYCSHRWGQQSHNAREDDLLILQSTLGRSRHKTVFRLPHSNSTTSASASSPFLYPYTLPFHGLGFWLAWAFCPGLLVAYHIILLDIASPLFIMLACWLGFWRTAAELRVVYTLLLRPLPMPEVVDLLLVSHVMPAIAYVLPTLVQVVCSAHIPSSLGLLLFWLHTVVAPHLMLYALHSAWGAPLQNGTDAGHRTQADHHATSRGSNMRWPPPLSIPAELEDDSRVPDAFKCPITLAIMYEPTQATSGQTYERSAITQWLQHHRLDPVTHTPLRRRHLSPNLCLRQVMEVWLEEQDKKLKRERR